MRLCRAGRRRRRRVSSEKERGRAMKDSDAVLAANLEFYRAFADRDFDAMELLWAQRAPVACTHPGWPVLAERAAMMESWAGMMSNPDAPRVTCIDERASLYGAYALVLRAAALDGCTSAASNLLVPEE